ncbi:BrnT family toxin [Vitreoscilla filiformis]|nr:BrnT family toxin [Vitreoscilla filiformis]
MNFRFDLTKDAANIAKHGVSLALAAQLEWDSALVWPDTRRDYGEPRQSALVLMGVRLFFVAFVDRPEGRRIISLRKANSREVNRYVGQD